MPPAMKSGVPLVTLNESETCDASTASAKTIRSSGKRPRTGLRWGAAAPAGSGAVAWGPRRGWSAGRSSVAMADCMRAVARVVLRAAAIAAQRCESCATRARHIVSPQAAVQARAANAADAFRACGVCGVEPRTNASPAPGILACEVGMLTVTRERTKGRAFALVR
jgi:hypothetical protein